MNVKDAILKRRSIRKFIEKEVKDEDIETLLQLAMAAPSAMNKQPWEFLVIKNKEILKSIQTTLQYMKYNAPLAIIVCGNKYRMLEKPVSDYFLQDCAAAIENILIGAVELGLGACWCGITPNPEAINQIESIVKIDEALVPVGLVYLGYPEFEKDPRTQYDSNKIHFIY